MTSPFLLRPSSSGAAFSLEFREELDLYLSHVSQALLGHVRGPQKKKGVSLSLATPLAEL